MGLSFKGFEAQPEVGTWTEKRLCSWDHHPSTPPTRSSALSDFPGESSSEGLGQNWGPPGQLADRVPLGLRARPRRPGGGDTGAVTVGPQIPHPVAPALVSCWGEGQGSWCQPGLSALSGQGGGSRKHPLGLLRDFSSALSTGAMLGTNRDTEV